MTRPTDRDYANLLRFRTELRRFDAWSHELGVLSRERDAEDARVVRLRLTELGGRRIDQLTQVHIAELARLAPTLQHVVEEAAAEA